MNGKRKKTEIEPTSAADYGDLVGGIGELLESTRRNSVRSVNAIMTATYWEIGRRIVEFEQGGEVRAGYGEQLLEKLSADLAEKYGKGFSRQNLQRLRAFYAAFPPEKIRSTLSSNSYDESGTDIRSTLSSKISAASAKEKRATLSLESQDFPIGELAKAFPLPWSHYVTLIGRARSPESLDFYLTEALRGGWSVRQLKRQINSQFYERTALSKDKAAVLSKGQKSKPEDVVTVEEEIKDPLVLEFLGLKDEYSESDLEDALIHHLETFLLELGGDFTFVGRQRRLRIDDEWYRVDLLFFHRRLKCLVIIDLKLGKFNHADAGQMHVYLNYAREHWTHEDENPPVGIILCAAKGESLARYATEGLPNKMLISEYLTALPDEKLLADEIAKTREEWEKRSGR